MIFTEASTSIQSRPQTVPTLPTFNGPIKRLIRQKTSINESKWKDQVKQDMKINNDAIIQSDKHIFISKLEDPLTNLREVLAKLSNNEAFKYMRQCRLIVGKLQKCWVDVNEELKPLTKSKEYLESAIEHVRKDIIITQETIDSRIHRPPLEPVNIILFFFFEFSFHFIIIIN